MKKVFLLMFILNIYYSCQNKKTYVNKDVINLLSEDMRKKSSTKDGLILPVSYLHLPVFGLTENNFLVCTRTDYLYYVYNSFYKKEFSNFNNFLSEFLNQKLRIDKKKFVGTETFFIILDKKVTKDYENYNFSEFYSKYCLVDNNLVSIKTENYQNGISNSKLFSIIYYLSINNYYVDENDYIGLYYVKNWDEIINNSK